MIHFLNSFVYSVVQIGFGLLVHPYQSMQSLVRDKVFVWMSLLPTLVLAVITWGWRWIIVPLVQYFFSCSTTSFFLCEYLSFFAYCLVFFCFYWQILLIYLLFRFKNIFR